jgi:diguanylate cyclase (GGDEF)-like protein/PAS domain S-box-containing protein
LPTVPLGHAYDPLLFAGSIVVACFASYVGLQLVGRSTAVDATGASVRWLAAASAALGVGIWSMHFTGMLALRLSVPVGYDPGLTLLSMVIAVLVSLLGLSVIRREEVPLPQLAGAGVLVGLAISGMHYTGMAAMQVPGEMRYDGGLLAVSVGVAIAASWAALLLALRFRDDGTSGAERGRVAAALLMGVAISGMHYTGMAAARFEGLRPGAALPGDGLLPTDGLALGVGAGALVILGLGLAAAAVDRRLHDAYTAHLRDRTRRYEALLTEISDVVTVLGSDGSVRYESPSVERVFGHDPDGRIGRPAFEHVHPGDRDRVRAALVDGLDRVGDSATVRYRSRTGGGSWRTVEATGVVPDHPELGTVVVTRDVTDRIEAQEKYRAIFRTNPSPVSLSTGGRFVEVNDAFLELYGFSRDEVIGETPEALGMWVDPDERDRIRDALAESGAVSDREVRLRDADGEAFEALFSASAVDLAGEEHWVSVVRDIRERKRFEEALQRQGLHDQLTGLPNRTLFRDRLQHALERADREGTEVAVLSLDVDRFKAVNDSLGHAAGDAVLRSVASRLREVLRDEDTVARVGGDEFAVLLEGVAEVSGIERAAGRVRRAFERPFRAGGNEFTLTASIGAAHSASILGDPDDLVRLADAAMYRVKTPGTTDLHVFDPDRDRDVTERLQREADLERAIREDEIVVHYQPVYRLATEEIVGAEALVRWEHPERGLVSPGEFIPLAEDCGLIVPLGRRVLRLALEQTGRWRAAGLVAPDRFRVGVNLSAHEYREEDLVATLEGTASAAGVPLSMLTLEITETAAVTGRGQLQGLRKQGLRLAIDDFGTGYSSLQYLRHLDADLLKIDRSFISGLEDDDRDRVLVRAILFLARETGITVVAEGVETEGQLAWLRNQGCPEAQGYHFARPVPAARMEELLAGEPERRAAAGG